MLRYRTFSDPLILPIRCRSCLRNPPGGQRGTISCLPRGSRTNSQTPTPMIAYQTQEGALEATIRIRCIRAVVPAVTAIAASSTSTNLSGNR